MVFCWFNQFRQTGSGVSERLYPPAQMSPWTLCTCTEDAERKKDHPSVSQFLFEHKPANKTKISQLIRIKKKEKSSKHIFHHFNYISIVGTQSLLKGDILVSPFSNSCWVGIESWQEWALLNCGIVMQLKNLAGWRRCTERLRKILLGRTAKPACRSESSAHYLKSPLCISSTQG